MLAADQRRFEAKWGVRWEPDRPAPDIRPIPVVCTRPGAAFQIVTGDQLVLSGWAMAPAGVRAVDAIVDGARGERLTYGVPPGRTDLAAAYPAYPDHLSCGFEGALTVAGMAEGRHQVVIRVSALDNRQVDLAVPFVVDPAAATSGRILAFVDRPVPGQRTIVTEGHLPVRGWALSSDGIEQVEALIDGNPRGVLTHGMLRPDIPEVYPEFPDVEHSGFLGVVPLPDLEPGVHRAVIRVTSHSGNQVEIVREFEVAPAQSARRPGANRQSALCGVVAETPTDSNGYLTCSPRGVGDGRSAHHSACSSPIDEEQPRLVQATVESIRAQAYDRWELWLAPDTLDGAGSSDFIEHLVRSDPRIKVAPPASGEGFAAFANAVVAQASSDFIAVVDAGDLLSPLALFEIARCPRRCARD